MKDGEVKYTEDKLVIFVASDNVPDTNIIEPYYCGWQDTELDTEWSKSLKEIFKPYLESVETEG